MNKHVLQVTGAEAGLALVDFLAARLALAATDAEAWVRAGAVYLDERRERDPALALRAGQKVVARPLVEAAPSLEPQVIYRDEDLAVLYKPAGLASMPLRQGGESLQDRLPDLLGPKACLLHRLDRETSGLLLCSLSRATRRELAEAVAAHRLLRSYLALVEGSLEQPELVIRSRLGRRHGRAASSQDPRAAEAVSRIRPLRRLGRRTLVEARLETGRTHQIRTHLSEAGLPIVGDERYGGPPAGRLALHAHRLVLTAPSQRGLDLHSPLPPELRALLAE